MKELPHDDELEQSVISAMILDNKVIYDVYDALRPEDFYRKKNQQIAEIIFALYKNSVDVDSVAILAEAKTRGKVKDIGGAAAIADILEHVPMSTNVAVHSEQLATLAMRRRLIIACGAIQQSAYDVSVKSNDIISEAYTGIEGAVGASLEGDGLVKVSSFLEEAIERYEAAANHKTGMLGVSTGVQELDHLTSGLQKGNLYLVAGRPSMGKTAFALHVIRTNCLNEKTVFCFSIEQPSSQLSDRLIASQSGVSMQAMKKGYLVQSDWQKVTDACGVIDSWDLWIDENSDSTATDIAIQAKRMAAKRHPDLIVIDYIQMMRTSNKGKRHELLGEITRTFVSLAKKLEVPVLALSQLNRSLEDRMNKRPTLADLRESGSLEQDAFGVIMLYRGEVYGEQYRVAPDEVELLLRKNRDGPIGTAMAKFNKTNQRFEEIGGQGAP